MAKLSFHCKKLMVEEISSRLNTKDILIVTDYKGLTAQALNELRKALRGISSEYVVVKDSMVKRALADSSNKTIAEFIEGEVGIVMDEREDPTCISKLLMKFSKDHGVLKIRGGIMKGARLSKEDIAVFAALPSRKVLLSKLANVVNAPVQGLASALSGIVSKIVYALNAVKDKRSGTGDKGQGTRDKSETAEKTDEKKEEVQVEKKEETQAEEDKGS